MMPGQPIPSAVPSVSLDRRGWSSGILPRHWAWYWGMKQLHYTILHLIFVLSKPQPAEFLGLAGVGTGLLVVAASMPPRFAAGTAGVRTFDSQAFSNPMTFKRKTLTEHHRTPKNSTEFERSSKNIPNLSTEDTGTTGLTCLLALWFLLFGLFAILFLFALQQVTQLNMQQPKKPTVKTEETTNGLLWAHVGCKGTIPRKYSHYKMVEPELQVLHTSKLIHFPAPMTFRRKVTEPKRAQHYLKDPPKHSKNIPNLSAEDTGTTGLTSLLALWFLLFGIFAILFLFALQQVTQLNMQQPKKPTVKTEETTNGLLCAHGWKGTIPRKYSHYKMVGPEPQVLHTSIFIHFPAPMTFRRKIKEPKRAQHYLKDPPKHSKNIPNLSTEDTGTTGLTCLLALWFLLFDIFVILFLFALQQVTQLNMQQPKKPTVKTEETTNGLLCAHGWKGTIPRKYSHYKMVGPEPQVLHTSIFIHFPAPMTFRRKM